MKRQAIETMKLQKPITSLDAVAQCLAKGIAITAILMVAATGRAEDVAADEATSKAKAPSVSAPRLDTDEEITNARLRASTGAKKVISFQSSFNYNGGTVDSPLAKERPQLSPGTLEIDNAKLTGNMSGKYRITDRDNLNLGVGVGWVTPTYQGQYGQVENPFATYTRVFKAGSTQNVFQVQYLHYSNVRQREVRRRELELSVAHTVLAPIGKTHWQPGVTMLYSHQFHRENAPSADLVDTVAAYPFVEYEFNDRYSFRTVYRGLTFFNTRAQNDTFIRDAETQSTGIGITLTRDIWLYPNIQWVWRDLRSEKTNVAINAAINL